jgi:hypothetical protein
MLEDQLVEKTAGAGINVVVTVSFSTLLCPVGDELATFQLHEGFSSVAECSIPADLSNFSLLQIA